VSDADCSIKSTCQDGVAASQMVGDESHFFESCGDTSLLAACLQL